MLTPGGPQLLQPAPIPYEPIAVRAAWVRALLLASVVTGVLSIVAFVIILVILSRLGQPGFDSRDAYWAEALYNATLVIRLVMPLAGIMFLIWIRRGYRNLFAMGTPGLRHRPGWAVGAWFVPFLNFVRPFEIVTDVWRASDPELPPGHSGWYALRRPSWFTSWWACWLGFYIVGAVAARVPGHTLETLQPAVWVDLISEVFGVPAAILGMRVVAEVTRRQRQRAVRFARHDLLPREFAVAAAT